MGFQWMVYAAGGVTVLPPLVAVGMAIATRGAPRSSSLPLLGVLVGDTPHACALILDLQIKLSICNFLT